MPPQRLALPTGSNKGREPYVGVTSLVNCYAEAGGADQKSEMQIWAAPGLDQLVAIAGSGGIRGMIEVDGVAYVVAGRTLYQVDSGGLAVVIGGIPSDGYVGMARNQRATGVQTVVVCDGLAWVTTGGTLTRITDADLPPPIDVCVVNRSAIFMTADGRMFRSEIDDASTVDGLDVAEAESAPDGGLRVVDRGSDVIAIGQRSFEVWSDQGGEAFGFARAHAARIGAVGARSVTKASVITEQTVTDTVAWVATDQNGAYGGVVMLDGYTPRKISNLYVDREIEAVADKTSIIASSYVARGHAFVTLRLPTRTLVYDTSTQTWHERQSRDSLGNATAWRVGLLTVLGGRVLAGDVDTRTLYWLDEDTHDEAGDELVMTVVCSPLNAEPGRIVCDRLFLDIVPGVGLGSGATQDVDPVVSMNQSHDGETWGGERTSGIGRQGARDWRVTWTRLGTFRQSTFAFSCSAAVVRGIMSAYWDGASLPP